MTTTTNTTPAPMSDEDMTRLFKKFHIATAGARALDIIADPGSDSWTFRDILVEMLRAQEAGYQQRISAQRLKAAKLADPNATLDKITAQPDNGLTAQRLARLRDEEWIHGPSPSNLIIVGPTGSGKSFLAQAIAHNACMNLFKVRYWRLAELAMSIDGVHHDSAATEKLVKTCADVHLLVLDDFFTTEISHHASRILFEILEARTGQATVIVSQLGAQDWLKMIPNQVTAESLVNRILHPSMTVALHGHANLREVHNPKEAI
ncbi:MAG: ATP-binding protein [Propionibacteriaceae bacterium]